MRNIGELVGVIRGVSFDGIVNDKEVEYLRIWAAKNRNLAYDQQQLSLISLIDDVIADNVITEEERIQLLEKSSAIMRNNGDEHAKIYELNGIIEGILADGYINDDEIFRLKEWVDNYEDMLWGHKPSMKLLSSLKDILEDGIINEVEREGLLSSLTSMIAETRFETKLEHLKQQVKSRKNIGIELIDILDNDEAIEKIHEYAERELMRALRYGSSISIEGEIVFISLCLIAMLGYDGKFYDDVRVTYSRTYNSYSSQKIEHNIRDILNRFRTDEKKYSETRIINIVLSNSLVPSYYLPAFFDFIYDIYKINFDYSLPEDMHREFTFVYDGLRNCMQLDSDEIKLNVTKKSYKLIRTTKQLLLEGTYIEDIIKLSILVVKLINKVVWDIPVHVYNPYLKCGFDKWIEKYREDTQKKEIKKIYGFRGRWKPTWELHGTNVYLIPPMHRIKQDVEYEKIRIEVLSGDRTVYRNKRPDVREIFGGYTIKTDPIHIDDPLSDISYRLLEGENSIYDSYRSLNRRFIFFDDKGQEISNNSNYKGIAVLCAGEGNDTGQSFFHSNHYKLSSLKVNIGDIVYIDGEIFNFSALSKPGLFGEKYPNQFVQNVLTEQTMVVYQTLEYITFESDLDADNHEISINNNTYTLKHFKYNVSRLGGINRFLVYLNVEEGDLYSITVRKKQGNSLIKVAGFDFALDPFFAINIENINNRVYSISIYSDLLKIRNTEVEITSIREDIFKFKNRGNDYRYLIPLEINTYKIDDYSWKPYSDDIWIGSVKNESTIRFLDPHIEEILVYGNDGTEVTRVPTIRDLNTSCVSIGFLQTYRQIYDYMMISILKEGRVVNGLFCYNKCILGDKTEILFNPVEQVLHVYPHYHGEGNVFFEITYDNGSILYKSEYLQNNDLITVEGVQPNTNYHVSFYEKKKGLSLNKDRLIGKFSRTFYSNSSFIDKTFHIIKGFVLCKDDDIEHGSVAEDNENVHSVPLQNAYLYIVKRYKDDMYSGELYKEGSRKGFRSNKIKDVIIVLSNEVIDGEIEIFIKKDNHNMGYDVNRKYVSERLLEPEIVYYKAEME